MATKIKKSSDLGEIWFPSRLWCCELISIVGLLWWPFLIQIGHKVKKSSNLGEIWFPSRLWCCELIFIVGLLWCSELDETFQKFCLTCVHIILRLRNFRMAAVVTKNVKNSRNWMKLNRNVVWHVYKWFWGLEISKCLLLPWKPQKHSI
jgi:hypothetical protein